MLQTEWPASRKPCPDSIKPFWNEKDNLIEYDELIFKGQQFVIPTALRPTIIKDVHSGHFGIVKCLERAKAAVYWPGYTLQIRDMVETCSLCQENRRTNSNMPLQQHPVADYPYQVLGTDMFATVVRHTNNPRSYWVRLTNGYVVRRNRTQINTTSGDFLSCWAKRRA